MATCEVNKVTNPLRLCSFLQLYSVFKPNLACFFGFVVHSFGYQLNFHRLVR